MSATCLSEPKLVKVRKEHQCQGCGKKINKGEEAYSSSFADGGNAWTFWECPECHEYLVSTCGQGQCKDFDFCIGLDYQVGIISECKNERNR